MRKILVFLFLITIFSYGVFSVSAGGPIFWKVNTRAEIEKGDARGVSIADNGALTLAPSLLEVFDTKQAYIWATVADRAGNIYLGTGNEGRIFKVDASGKGSLLYKSSELSVMALAVDGQGNVFAGTSPDGKIYKISSNGEAKVFFEPKSKYIWSMVFDAQGRLLVGTGDKGVIYRVNADGSGAPLIKTTQTNITALRVDAAGNIIAGTDPGGMVLRVSSDGKAFTLFDSTQKEVRDLAIGKNGDIYVLTLAESVGAGATNASTPPPAAPAVVGADEGIVITISDVQPIETPATTSSSVISAATGSSAQSKSVLYKIDSSGASSSLWDSKDAVAFAISAEEDGRVIVGTGQKGRVYSIAAGRGPLLLTQTSEGQTSRFVRGGDQLFAASSNLGKLFKVSNDTAATGIYTSTVRDAQTTADWGRVSWIGDGAIELQTRSGNTATPDSTWSDWSAPSSNYEGEAIKSPSARYVQWRATMKRGAGVAPASPKLREVTISYLPRNLSPQITSLNLLPMGVTLQTAIPQMQIDPNPDQNVTDTQLSSALVQIPPRRTFQRGAVSLQWQAEDRNGDTIEYAVFYRNAAGGDFFQLKSSLRETYFTVEPNALPDGRYIFKVVASDGLSNPANLALSDEQETEPVEIDNTPPSVTAGAPKLSGNSVEVIFQAADATSIIRRAEYQIDGGPWRSIFPVDGISDSRREEFRVAASFTDGKEHVIALRAFDANTNVGSAKAPIGNR